VRRSALSTAVLILAFGAGSCGPEHRTPVSPSCSYSVSLPTNAFGPSGGSGKATVTVAQGCTWGAASQSDWIRVDDSKILSGNGTITFTVAPSQQDNARSGSLIVAKQTFAISQDSCRLRLSSNGLTFPDNGGTKDMTVDVHDGCEWAASDVPAWISLEPKTGTGAATVHVRATAQSDASVREATLRIGSEVVSLRQDGHSCTFDLAAAPADFPLVGGTGTLRVSTNPGCRWAFEKSAPWLSTADPANGVGPAALRLIVLSNPDANSRRTTLHVSTASADITQSGQSGCNFRVSPLGQGVHPRDPFDLLVPHPGGVDAVDVSASEGCAWTASATPAWLRVLDGANRAGSGRVTYEVQRDPDPSGSSA
jgi:hypothetical protein